MKVQRALRRACVACLYASAALIFTTATAQTPTPAGYWNLNEGSGPSAADSSGSGNNGTLTNSPAWVAGQISNALSFSTAAKSYVAVAPSSSLTSLYTHGMTVAAWIKPHSAGGGGRGRIVDKDNNNGGWFLSMYNSNAVQFGVDVFPKQQPTRISTTSIKVDTWQHVAATWDGSIAGANIHIYVNGVLADGTSADGVGIAESDADTPLAIGNRTFDLLRAFDGAIDEVRVYGSVLTPTQIQAIADAQAPAAPSGLTALWGSDGHVALNWAAAADNIAVTGYLIERCAGASCSNFAPLAQITDTTYSDGTVTAATVYNYRVRATDAATNLSTYSNLATASSGGGPAPDTQAPTVPTGLSSANITTTGVTVNWTASVDLPNPGGTGVGGYYVYRNGNTTTPIATVTTGTSYNDSGLASGTNYSYQVAAFDKATPRNVSAPSSVLSVTTSSGTPAWIGGDIGTTGRVGSYSVSGSTYTVKGAGADIWGNSDAFQFVSQPFTGDGSITARVVTQTNTNVWAKAGVMFRETLTGGSTFAAIFVTPGNGTLMEGRSTKGGAAISTRGPATPAPYWVRLVRAGSLLTSYTSADGVKWASVSQYTVPMASQINVGLAVTSHAAGTLSTATFDNVVIAGPLSVSVAPTFANLAPGASQQFTATVLGASNTAVTWQVNGVAGGSSATGTISATGLYVAPTTLNTSPSTFTVSAVSVQSTSASGSAQVTVSGTTVPTVDVTTYKNDLARTGANLQEAILTPANVRSSTFGLQRLLPGDAAVFAQPLYVSGLKIAGALHNVVFVATEHNSVYAYDADSGAKLWQSSLTPAGETTSDSRACDQVSPEIGVTATPVIDKQSGPNGAIYLIAATKDSSGLYHQRLHALDITTGGQLFNGPTEIQATYPTASGGTTVFDPSAYKERTGLLLLNGEIYTTWSSHCDFDPYTGWIIAYSKTTLARTRILNVAANSNDLGPAIWMSGGAPAADSEGNIYLLTGNGVFETTLDANGFPNLGDYGNSFLKISTAGNTLKVVDYFTMWNEIDESKADLDFGGGGALLLPDLTDSSGTVRHLAVGAGKDGNIYVVNRDSMGKFDPARNNIWQEIDISTSLPIRSTPAYFNGRIYYSGRGAPLKAFTVTNGKLSTSPSSQTSILFGYPGTIPVVSANGTTNGIVWAAEPTNPGVLHAYDATNLANELYNSKQAANGRDTFGFAQKYTSPTVAGGRVFVGTKTGVAVFGVLQ